MYNVDIELHKTCLLFIFPCVLHSLNPIFILFLLSSSNHSHSYTNYKQISVAFEMNKTLPILMLGSNEVKEKKKIRFVLLFFYELFCKCLASHNVLFSAVTLQLHHLAHL